MKHLLVIFTMLFSLSAYAQFTTSSSIFYGFEVDKAKNVKTFQASVAVTPQYEIDKFKMGIKAYSIFNDSNSLPTVLVGSELSYNVWNSENLKYELWLTGNYLYGSGGEQLIGGGLNYGIDRTKISFGADWNYKRKVALIRLGIGWTFIN